MIINKIVTFLNFKFMNFKLSFRFACVNHIANRNPESTEKKI